ncbi:MAG: sulfite exporter TauE/SafE family protein [Bdellovibrionaceae bacterium]|nr:sulfite exporter TauE/SafE family protein [Pseudobdellovibrionaceae bacterium]MDW8190190.1 sulfite exporter TauE/SafE family protein [Pseudobdellovibrionaceae bacterium]
METSLSLTLLLSTLGVAFMGGWHCAGMCGPIAALNTSNYGAIFYQVGRAIGYLTLGSLSGHLGHKFYLSLEEPQKKLLPILLASLMLLYTMHLLTKNTVTYTLWVRLKNLPPKARGLILGIINSFLPCHFLYGFLAVAATTQSWAMGGLILLIVWFTSSLYLFGFSHLARNLRLWQIQNPTKAQIVHWGFFLALILSLVAHYLPLPH